MSDESSIITCQNCGEPLEADWKECPVCLTPTSSGVLTCPNCQASIKKNWKICPRCETALSGWKTPPAQESSAAEKGNDSKKEQVFVSMAEDKSMATVGFGLELPIIKGDVLGDRYRIIQPLGAGGFGEVYQVDDLVLNEQMALKIVVAGEGKAQRAAEQILHEFKLRERINDTTYIIKAQDPRPCEHKGLSLVLLPMEFANGKSMRQWLVQNQDIEKRQKAGLELFRQACLGVKAIHDAGLVHLDIKPDNILIVEGKAKIADFGIGRYGASQFANNPDQLLRQGIGTPQYMSPEQFQVARQKDVGPASDIYSLGIVLFELLDGNLPFDGTAIELRDKHLNMQPPRLTEKLGKWMRIADRCLAKNPGERYPDIGRLIADLDRAAQGATLSIDVSCPKCGHINANPDSKVCGKCQASLASLFRPCPVCTRSIRLDIKTCPGCGQAVAAYYLLLDRKEQIEKLKDEDPVEAIEILEMVLRDGADDYQERAVELIKDLRQKQSQVGSLIAEAEKATASAAPKQAIKAWQKILEIIPRHKVAVEQVQKLESLLKDFRERWEKAIRLMNEAKFQDADNILQSCIKDIPARNDIRGMLDTCRSRSQKYRDAFDHAETTMRGKLIQEADKQISEALSQAPDSEEALAIAAELSKKLEKTKKMVDQAYRELSGAHFSKVGEKITEIKQLQADNPKTEEIAKELRKTQKEYSKHLKAAVEAETSFALGKALEEAILAQNECPDSKEISDVITSIKEKQLAANAHLEEAKTALEEARFEEVEQYAKKAKELWSELDIKAYSESVIQSATIEYRSKIDEAQHLFNKHDFKKALDACEKALQICPKAAKVGWLKDQINDVIKKKEKRSAQIIGIILLIKNITLAALLGILIVALTPLAFLADKLCSRIFKKTRIRYYRWPEALWSCWSRQKDNIWESKALSPQIDDILAESLIHEAPPEIKAERQIFIKRLKQKLLTRKTAMWIIVLLGVVFIFRSGCDNRRHIRQAQGYLVNQKFDQARMELSECGWFCASGKAKLWNMLYDAENENRQIKASSSSSVKYQSKKANATAWKSNSGTLSDGLIHYYSCEESTNKRGLVDIVSGKNSSLMWGSPKVKRKGIKNYGWAFNGNDAIAWSDTLLPDLAAGDDFTLSIWAYNTGLSNSNDSIWSTYCTKGSKAYFLLDIYKSKLRFIGTNMGFKNNSQTNILSISSNQWYHYVLRKKGSLYTIFVNGTSISYATGNSTVTWDKDKRRRFIIGSQNSASPGKYWWNGYFDEFGVWARSLSDEEVSKLYNRGSGLSYNQIVGAD